MSGLHESLKRNFHVFTDKFNLYISRQKYILCRNCMVCKQCFHIAEGYLPKPASELTGAYCFSRR